MWSSSPAWGPGPAATISVLVTLESLLVRSGAACQ
jgi:hypothetical protein